MADVPRSEDDVLLRDVRAHLGPRDREQQLWLAPLEQQLAFDNHRLT